MLSKYFWILLLLVGLLGFSYTTFISNHKEKQAVSQVPQNNLDVANKPQVVENTNATEQIVKDTNATEGVDYVATSNNANRRVKYYYYIPSQILQNTANSYPVMVLVPGLNGDGQAFASAFKDFAKKEGFVIIAPTFVFDENDFNNEASYQFPAAWSGLALLSMINSLSDKGVKSGKLYMLGFSAGAQFSLRFTLLHPDLVKACASHGNGARVTPLILDSVKYFITVGKNDEQYRIDNARIFYNAAQNLHMAALYREYNIGHEISADQINDSLEFFRQSNYL